MAVPRGSLVLLAALALGACVHSTLEPTSKASWTPRDRELLADAPYAQAPIPEAYQRHVLDYHRKEVPGTIVVDTDNRYLYYVLPRGKAIRYGVTVGEEALAWSGVANIGRMEEWPGAYTGNQAPAREYPGLREPRAAQSDGRPGAVSLSG